MRYENKAAVKRKEKFHAEIAGHKWFVTIEPCKNGHNSPKRTSNGNCIECEKARNAANYLRIKNDNRPSARN